MGNNKFVVIFVEAVENRRDQWADCCCCHLPRLIRYDDGERHHETKATAAAAAIALALAQAAAVLDSIILWRGAAAVAAAAGYGGVDVGVGGAVFVSFTYSSATVILSLFRAL